MITQVIFYIQQKQIPFLKLINILMNIYLQFFSSLPELGLLLILISKFENIHRSYFDHLVIY